MASGRKVERKMKKKTEGCGWDEALRVTRNGEKHSPIKRSGIVESRERGRPGGPYAPGRRKKQNGGKCGNFVKIQRGKVAGTLRDTDLFPSSRPVTLSRYHHEKHERKLAVKWLYLEIGWWISVEPERP